jgi:hypothetical protein
MNNLGRVILQLVTLEIKLSLQTTRESVAISLGKSVIAKNEVMWQSRSSVIARNKGTWQSHREKYHSFYEIATLRSQ